MSLTISESNQVATVTLNRPEVKNAFNQQLISELTSTFQKLSNRKDLRAVVLTGEGKVFCAGADLQMMQKMVSFSLEENKKDAEQLFAMFEAIYNCALPVIAVVRGAVYGGALGLIACADVVLCEEKTQLCFSEVKLGILPALISGFIAQKLPVSSYSAWMLSGKVFSASEALQKSFVTEVVAESELAGKLNQWLTAFRDAGPEAVRECKKLLRKLPNLSINQIKEETTTVIAEVRVSKEGQEGLKSFLEKRSPSWKTT